MSEPSPLAVTRSFHRLSTWSYVLRLRRKSAATILRSRSTELRARRKRVQSGIQCSFTRNVDKPRAFYADLVRSQSIE